MRVRDRSLEFLWRQEMKANRGGAEPAVAICAACGAASPASVHVLQAALVRLRGQASLKIRSYRNPQEVCRKARLGDSSIFSVFPAIFPSPVLIPTTDASISGAWNLSCLTKSVSATLKHPSVTDSSLKAFSACKAALFQQLKTFESV